MYFKNFSKIEYPFYNKEKRVFTKSSVNITQRLKIVDYIKRYKTNFSTYTIRDGERADTLANRLYEDPNVHWAIYLTNDMINPYTDWPMSGQDLNDYISEKYSGSSIFVPDVWNARETDESTEENRIYVYDVLENVSIDEITNLNYGDFDKKVIPYTDLVKITKSPKVKVIANGTFYESIITSVRSEYYEVVVEKKPWNVNNFTDNEFLIYEIDQLGTKTCIKVPITRFIDQTRYSIKEFRVNGQYKDPFHSFGKAILNYSENPYANFVYPSLLSNDSSDVLGSFANTVTDDSFIDLFSKKGDDNTFLNASYYITNEYYELEVNEAKRNVLVPIPSMLEEVLKNFEEIFTTP